MKQRLLFLSFLVLLGGSAEAASLYDESKDGDLSTDSSSYDEIEVLEGENTITVTTGPAASDLADFFELVIGKDLALERIELVSIDLGVDNEGGTRFSNCLGPGDDCLPFTGIAEILMVQELEGADLLALLEEQAPGQLTRFFRIGESTGPATTVLRIVAPEPGFVWQVAAALGAIALRAHRRSGRTRPRPPATVRGGSRRVAGVRSMRSSCARNESSSSQNIIAT